MKRPEFTGRIAGSRFLLATLLGALAIGGFVACNSSKSSARGTEPTNEPKNQPQKVTGVNARPMKLDALSDFSLTDQSGKSKTLAALKGKPWVAAFFFTRCPTICPKLTQRMQLVQGRAKAKGLDVTLVGFSVDPTNDTPEVLSAYAKQYNLDTSNWLLLTGAQSEIDKMAKSFKVGLSGVATEGAEHLGIVHSGHLLLVDSSGTLRGYYRSGDDDQIDRLMEELAQLQDGS